MYKCNFCQRNDLPSRQSFYAHLKWCAEYPKNKSKRKAASGMSLREAVPQGQPHQPISSPLPSSPLPHTNDPLEPFRDFLQGLGAQSPSAGGTQETPQQKRRRLLQAAKSQAIDHNRSFIGTVTAEMRAEAKLSIDRELRNEPLDEFTPQEVRELVEGLRDRVYTSLQRRQEKETRRAQEGEDRKRAEQLEHDRTQQVRTKKKEAFLIEARRRAIVLFQTRSLSLVQRIHMMDEILTPLDAALTGEEWLSEAYASIEVVLQGRVADWEAQDAAKAAKQQEEWMEFAVVTLIIIAGGFMFVKAPAILLWLLNMFSHKPADSAGDTKKPTEETSSPSSDQPPPARRVKKIRRPPQSPFSSDNPLAHL